MTEDQMKTARERALLRLELACSGDPETSHMEADEALLHYLREIGENAIADAWHATGTKWYA